MTPTGEDLNGSYQFASTPLYADGIGNSILELAKITPAGMLVFLPSHKKCDDFQSRWKTNGIWDRLSKLKDIYIEKEKGMNIEETYLAYSMSCKKRKGGILFCVYRGKMSEGIDFKDELARCVVCVGIAYPSTVDVHLKEKRDYHKRNHLTKGIQSDEEWYTTLAFRAMNQALGRCIRHRRDWGAIVFLDSRFNQREASYLSKWIRGRIQFFDSFSAAKNGLEEFFTHRQQNAIQVGQKATSSTISQSSSREDDVPIMQRSVTPTTPVNTTTELIRSFSKTSAFATPSMRPAVTPTTPIQTATEHIRSFTSTLFQSPTERGSYTPTPSSTAQIQSSPMLDSPLATGNRATEPKILWCRKCRNLLFRAYVSDSRYTCSLSQKPMSLSKPTDRIPGVIDSIHEPGQNVHFCVATRNAYSFCTCKECGAQVGYRVVHSKDPSLENSMICPHEKVFWLREYTIVSS
jgi:Fanconi anemia group J protein